MGDGGETAAVRALDTWNLVMLDLSSYLLILGAAFVASASPGPATLALAGTAMSAGRGQGLALAAGITSGSLIWSAAAAMGLSALMLSTAWLVEILRYAGAAYLIYLGWKALRSALTPGTLAARPIGATRLRTAYAKGLLLHLTNPKAIFFFGSLYTLGVPADASPLAVASVVALVGCQSVLIFHGYALVFSSPAVTRAYLRARRPLEALFALCFGAAGVKLLLARV